MLIKWKKTPKEDLRGSIVLGILGALIGGFLSNIVFGLGVIAFESSSIVVALAGSLVLLFLGRGVPLK